MEVVSHLLKNFTFISNSTWGDQLLKCVRLRSGVGEWQRNRSVQVTRDVDEHGKTPPLNIFVLLKRTCLIYLFKGPLDKKRLYKNQKHPMGSFFSLLILGMSFSSNVQFEGKPKGSDSNLSLQSRTLQSNLSEQTLKTKN